MKKSKLFSLIALALAALLVLSACGNAAAPAETTGAPAKPAETETQAPAPAEPVTITYCNFNSSGGNEETLSKMVAAFESEYPNIKVEVETIGYSDYFTQMQTRVAGGTAPD